MKMIVILHCMITVFIIMNENLIGTRIFKSLYI